MIDSLLHAIGSAPSIFVVGKGGVGKTTTAGALALELATRGERVHLITTDPAESLSDLFLHDVSGGEPAPSGCTDALTIEAFDARAYADRWLGARRTALAEIIEQGTYLERADVDGVLELAVPGVDEAMGALRIVDLDEARGRDVIDRIVVDTAPTGHTLRLLDAGPSLATWVATMRAMAHKAAVVASSLMRANVRLQGERVLDELDADLARLDVLLRAAAFVVVHRADAVVQAETERLAELLHARGRQIRAFVATGDAAAPQVLPQAARFAVPRLEGPARGCDGLRLWAEEVAESSGRAAPAAPPAETSAPAPGSTMAQSDGSGAAWMRAQQLRILWFAGKGGVGKTTCAAAAALGLADDRAVSLHSTDPAGSLGDVLDREIGDTQVSVSERLRAQQVDATRAFDAWRSEYRTDVGAIFARLGLEESATLDRRVIESALDLAPLGIDEIVALDHMIESLDSTETLVIDTAPTGHFLRLLAMPQLALDWSHALLRILLRYGGAAQLDDLSERVLAFAKRLKSLRTQLTDPNVTGVFVVTLDEPMVRAETERLRAQLRHAGVPEAGVILNRAAAAITEPVRASHLIRAPQCAVPPAGADALRAFFQQWELA